MNCFGRRGKVYIVEERCTREQKPRDESSETRPYVGWPARLLTIWRCFLVAYTSSSRLVTGEPSVPRSLATRITVLERSTDTGAGRGTQCPGSKMVQRQTYQHMFTRPQPYIVTLTSMSRTNSPSRIHIFITALLSHQCLAALGIALLGRQRMHNCGVAASFWACARESGVLQTIVLRARVTGALGAAISTPFKYHGSEREVLRQGSRVRAGSLLRGFAIWDVGTGTERKKERSRATGPRGLPDTSGIRVLGRFGYRLCLTDYLPPTRLGWGRPRYCFVVVTGGDESSSVHVYDVVGRLAVSAPRDWQHGRTVARAHGEVGISICMRMVEGKE